MIIKKVYEVTVADIKEGRKFLFERVRNPLTFLLIIFIGILYFALYMMTFPAINYFLIGLRGKTICPIIKNNEYCSKCNVGCVDDPNILSLPKPKI